MFQENNYDIICRDGSLGTLLTAFFLIKSGKKVLLLPPLSSKQHPPLLLPLAAGYPLRILVEGGLPVEDVQCRQSNWFSWTDGQHVFNCPATFSERMPALSAFMGDHFSWFQNHFSDFQNIWKIINTIMENGLMIPAAGLKDHGKILKVLLTHQELLENRMKVAGNFYSGTEIPGWLSNFFASMVPQISVFRYKSLPLVSFAYGIATMFQNAELVDLGVLQNYLRKFILENGGETTSTDYQVIFDGKWYIGIGTKEKVEVRSRAYVADSDERSLENEIPSMYQRRDFFRQFTCQEKGIAINCLHGHVDCMEELPDAGRWFCHEHDSFLAVMLQKTMAPKGVDIDIYSTADFPAEGPAEFIAKLPVSALLTNSRINFQPQKVERKWGYKPKLPPVMGGAFLPVISMYKKFYHVGWENLPGFGFCGLAYTAKKTAERIIDSEYM